MKILIIDDHPVVRAGVRRLLSPDPETDVAEAASGEEALAALPVFQPNLAIVDLNLQGMSGFDIIVKLARAKPRPRILVLSMHDDPIFAMRALDAGADGYVTKNAPPVQILEAVQRLASGETYIGPELAQQLALWNLREAKHPLEKLSRRDLKILRLLGDGRSIQQIADALGIGYKTVSNNCSQIKAKLGVKRTAELIRFAIQNRELGE